MLVSSSSHFFPEADLLHLISMADTEPTDPIAAELIGLRAPDGQADPTQKLERPETPLEIKKLFWEQRERLKQLPDNLADCTTDDPLLFAVSHWTAFDGKTTTHREYDTSHRSRDEAGEHFSFRPGPLLTFWGDDTEDFNLGTGYRADRETLGFRAGNGVELSIRRLSGLLEIDRAEGAFRLKDSS